MLLHSFKKLTYPYHIISPVSQSTLRSPNMALLLTSPPSIPFKNPNPNPTPTSLLLLTPNPHSLSFSLLSKTTTTTRRFPTFRFNAAGESPIVDEWGEKSEPDTEPPTKLSDTDPPKDEDEWGGVGSGGADGYVLSGNGSASTSTVEGEDKLLELKRCLVDTVYGTDFGFRASAEVRAEVSELVNQLEAANPTPAPMEAVDVLDGNWVLLYTASSELLPLLAVGTTPVAKVERICQAIKTSIGTIENSVTISSPFATFSFSADASFEVRTPSRIQVEFKEGTFQPPGIKSSIDLPDNVDIFGQSINLSPLQQSLNPLQDAVVSIARAISGQPPLKVPIPGERTKSWLLTTYLDKDLRISRGDGGLFVLAKEGSPLIEN